MNCRATSGRPTSFDDLPPMIDARASQMGPAPGERLVTAFGRGVQEMTDPTGTWESGSVNRPTGSIR
jgi:hypothetical protein